mmetsp:Transcript_8719/g.15887  ORF Transcript_8719/g.15887 Transcript_8719/m.15887 type:complete len:91 (-) Transcript_8719:111-383(-)
MQVKSMSNKVAVWPGSGGLNFVKFMLAGQDVSAFTTQTAVKHDDSSSSTRRCFMSGCVLGLGTSKIANYVRSVSLVNHDRLLRALVNEYN